MPVPNYRHAKRQKEIAKKAQQQVKQQRRTSRTPGTEAGPESADGTAPAGTDLKTGTPA